MNNSIGFFDKLRNDDCVEEGLILDGLLMEKSSAKNIEAQSV